MKFIYILRELSVVYQNRDVFGLFLQWWRCTHATNYPIMMCLFDCHKGNSMHYCLFSIDKESKWKAMNQIFIKNFLFEKLLYNWILKNRYHLLHLCKREFLQIWIKMCNLWTDYKFGKFCLEISIHNPHAHEATTFKPLMTSLCAKI